MSLSDYINPPDDIVQALNDLDIYFQTINQENVQVFIKKGRKISYSGTLGEHARLMLMQEYFDLTKGSTWDNLTKVIYLLDTFTTEFNLSKLSEIEPEEAVEFVTIIQRGVVAHKKLVEWLAPLRKGAILQAIYDATKVTLGDKYKTFEVLDLGEIEMENTPEPILYPNLLRIQNPDQLIQYFKHAHEKPVTSMIVTYQLHRLKEMDFKSGFYIFFLYNGHIYSVSNSERRYNIDNTAGMRNPDRYLERKYKNTWLPVKWMLEGDPSKQELMVPDSSVYIAETFENINKEQPEILYWFAIFMVRVKEYIDKTNNIILGVTPNDALLLLEDFNKRDDREFTEHASRASTSDYLVKAYGSKIKDLVVSDAALPPMIAPRERVVSTIRWERRKVLAESVREMVFQDYRDNFEKAMKWLQDFVKKRDYEEVFTKALEDDVYPRMFYLPTFSGTVYAEERWEYGDRRYGHDEDVEIVDLPAIFYEKILRDGVRGWVVGGRYVNEFNWTPSGDITYWKDNEQHDVNCPICDKFKWKTIIKLSFKDYRQICAFFNIPPSRLPEWVVTHLHQQNETDAGNSILNDVDPMDLISSPWFREDETKPKFIVTTPYSLSYIPHFSFYMPICGRCRKRIEKKMGIYKPPETKLIKYEEISFKKLTTKVNGWAYAEKYQFYDEKRHYFYKGRSLCGRMYNKYKIKTDKKHSDWNNCSRCQKSFDNAKKDGKIRRRIEENDKDD